jgi:endonuclease/exonuclease/phosphatase family metal-dependent hydrolase/regulation of enolase protein 1 (concanavalin A-like superfamily)
MKLAVRLSALAFALVVVSGGSAVAQSLPNGWSTTDVGAVGATGTASGTTSALSAEGAGADIWDTADAFRFVYTTLTGDGSVVAKVTSEENVANWTKAGVMMRDSLAAGSRHAMMLVSPGKGLAFQRRATANGESEHTDGGAGTAPYFVKLTRAGNVFTAYKSTNGTTWSTEGSDTITMGTTLYVGVAVSSHVTGTLATASFSSLAVSADSDSEAGVTSGSGTGGTVPAGWTSVDIGGVGATGTASGTTSNLTVDGAGADIWNAADAFHFVYTTLTGDGTVVTQVAGEEYVADWTKAGVMMRETLAPGARHAAMLVSPGKGLAFQRRVSAGGQSSSTAGGSGKAPYFVRLVRSGNTFTAARSLDGSNWTTVDTETIAMASAIYVGVAVSSHVAGTLATATFASTAVTPGPAGGTVTAPPPPSGSAKTLRLLHWNAHHGGIGSDGKYDPTRIAALVAKVNPDVVSFNEVDDAAQVTAILTSLNAKTSGGWKSYAAWKTVFMTRLAVSASTPCTFDAGQGWKSVHVSIQVNGRALNLWSTHLDVDSASKRLAEVGTMQSCAKAWPEAHIIAGDFNMQAGSTEYNAMVKTYSDAWLTAKALGTAVNYAGNCDGCTRNSRIDYVFTSKAQTFATVKSAQIIDSRDANGVTPSDHKPMLVTFNIN